MIWGDRTLKDTVLEQKRVSSIYATDFAQVLRVHTLRRSRSTLAAMARQPSETAFLLAKELLWETGAALMNSKTDIMQITLSHVIQN